jgi:hypothetical protein
MTGLVEHPKMVRGDDEPNDRKTNTNTHKPNVGMGQAPNPEPNPPTNAVSVRTLGGPYANPMTEAFQRERQPRKSKTSHCAN